MTHGLIASFTGWEGWNALVAIGTLALAAATIIVAVAAFLQFFHQRRYQSPLLVQVPDDPQTAEMRNVVFIRPYGQTPPDPAFEAEATHRGEVVLGSASKWEQRPDGAWVGISIPIHNVGSGIAFINEVTGKPLTGWTGRVSGWADDNAIPPETSTRLNFLISADYDELTMGGRGLGFECDVRYQDQWSRQQARTRFQLGGTWGLGDFRVMKREVAHRRWTRRWHRIPSIEGRYGAPEPDD